MGCWNETDAITRLPIMEDEPVTMVILTPAGLSEQWWSDMTYTIRDNVKKIFKGTYDDYGWINEVEYKGEYKDLRDDLRTVFFRKAVWDEVVALYPASTEPVWSGIHWDGAEIPEFLDELFGVMQYACACRLSLETHSTKGRQSGWKQDSDAYRRHRAILSRSMAEWKKTAIQD